MRNTQFLNGIRFALALWVAMGHFYLYIGQSTFIKIPGVSAIILSGSVAVDGFMIITGFLMTYHYMLRENDEHVNSITTFYKFWLRRFFRLYPLYFLLILVAFLAFKFNYQAVYHNYTFFTGKVLALGNTYSKESIPGFNDLFYHLTFLHGLLPVHNTSILGPAWSLSLEVQYYLLFPFIYWFFFTNLNAKVSYRLLGLIIGSVILELLSTKLWGNWDIKGMLVNLGAPSFITYKTHFFALGMIMAGVLLEKIKPIYLIICLLLITPFIGPLTIIVMLVINFLMFYKLFPLKNKYINGFANWLSNMFSGRISTFGADLSYSFYLIHMIIMPGVLLGVTYISPFGKQATALIAFLIFVTITGVISYLLFLAVEKPFIKIGKEFISKRFSKQGVSVKE